MKMKALFVVCVLTSCFFASSSWNLENLGVTQNYYVSSIAVFRTRAFLSLPRSIPCNNQSSPTVVEVNWNADVLFTSTNLLNVRNKLMGAQKWNNCTDIQDAISLDIEARQFKVWILDKGNAKCPPKIVSYSLLQNDILDNMLFEDIPRHDLSCIKIGPKSINGENKAYIGNPGDNTLIVMSLKDLTWWKVKLSVFDHPNVPVVADIFAISKADPTLFITSKNDAKLFELNLNTVSNMFSASTEQREVEVNVTFIGEMLGLSSALETDFKLGLNYYMVRDYAILRWHIGLPLIAENHDVLGQSYERLPYVSELFTGPHHGLWALINPLSEEECYDKSNSLIEAATEHQERVVQILHYNLLNKELEVGDV